MVQVREQALLAMNTRTEEANTLRKQLASAQSQSAGQRLAAAALGHNLPQDAPGCLEALAFMCFMIMKDVFRDFC